MEEKESTVSGSPGNSGTESPPAPLRNLVAHQVGPVNAGTKGSFGSTATATITPSSTGGGGPTAVVTATGTGSADSFGKKKRGRPRKYDADGNLRLSYATPPSGSTTPFSLSSPVSSPSEFSSSSKRGRGRPPGSGNWQLLASLGEFNNGTTRSNSGEIFANTAGGDFTPHVVTVSTGEDVAGKIFSFAQKGPRGICVLSANGAVSNVTIRQPGSSGGILTYEGRFEILSLSGSFTVSDTTARSRTGGLSVSLAGPDGRVIGGGIAGLLTAASPIQIVVGSFMPNGYKVHKRKHHREHTVASPPPSALGGPVTMASPISQAKPVMVEPCLPTMPTLPVQSHVGVEHNNTITDHKENPNGSSDHFEGWNGSSDSRPDLGPSPDINVSVPGE
ncbi:PPC domain containing protein [Parasponia andersonii]|uniref:AT-hook motif nuclear-localized protein n=1 Tax=Parasponia andersonii TaxID=3476 RepID=A0A2P5C519_PARAD|nr:PPC domain containing protein [Parasponia andersonii]